MKIYLKILVVILLLVTNESCSAQKLRQTTADAQKLKDNEKRFLNRPLKLLLKQIRPQIKMVTASPTWAEATGRFNFKFNRF